ncbi:MAG: PIN domain-containing protein [Haloferacaceae archaeon]
MILDTEYLDALADGHEGAIATATALDARGVPTRVPAAVVWELYARVGGAANPDASRRRGNYEQLLAGRETIGLTPDVARRAGELRGEHARSDRLADLDGADSLVAAHGLSLDEPVVSNDVDFRDVAGLRVETY